MLPAIITTLLFAASVMAASRSARLMGSQAANFWRIAVATLLLAGWAHGVGQGWGGGAFWVFFLSGVVGFGVGDYALFEALPRLGPRLSSLMVNCLGAPIAAAIEWGWLGTRLSDAQLLCGTAILAGVALSLAPEPGRPMPAGHRMAGMLFGTVAGFGQGFGAVLTRKAFAVSRAEGFDMDGGTAAYQRILGGLLFVAIPFAWQGLRRRLRGAASEMARLTPAQKRTARNWVLANALAGPALGVAFFQWALKTTPSGVVLPITAMSPLVVVPFTYLFDGDRPGWRSLAGGIIAVGGVIGLATLR